MCTALSFQRKHHYFGRNLDLERGYGEQIVITPRQYPLAFRYEKTIATHYAMIGTAAVVGEYPLYFEATNEKGLSMAGLNFPGNAYFPPYAEGKNNIASFELTVYLLGLCKSVDEAVNKLGGIQVVGCSFSRELPVTPLHWMISDRERSVVLECTKAGMKIFENPFGVLTNNPTFGFHLTNMNNYMSLHPGGAENQFSNIPLENYSLGMGALGLPGDFSSASRFVKAVFVKENSVCADTETECVNQFFHILYAVAMPRGCVATPNAELEYTRYSCCCNTDTQVYYFTTYEDMTIRQIAMKDADLDSTVLHRFSMGQ